MLDTTGAQESMTLALLKETGAARQRHMIQLSPVGFCPGR